MSGFIDPEAKGRALRDNDNYERTRNAYTDWLWKIYQQDEEGAIQAQQRLLDAVNNQTASARALVAQVSPKKRGLTRPLSGDEEVRDEQSRSTTVVLGGGTDLAGGANPAAPRRPNPDRRARRDWS